MALDPDIVACLGAAVALSRKAVPGNTRALLRLGAATGTLSTAILALGRGDVGRLAVFEAAISVAAAAIRFAEEGDEEGDEFAPYIPVPADWAGTAASLEQTLRGSDDTGRLARRAAAGVAATAWNAKVVVGKTPVLVDDGQGRFSDAYTRSAASIVNGEVVVYLHGRAAAVPLSRLRVAGDGNG